MRAMNSELFFIYDSHCPWSYATLPLVNEIHQHFPEISLTLFHCAHYDGGTAISRKTLDSVTSASTSTFSNQYLAHVLNEKNSTLIANLMAWVSAKLPEKALDILNSISQQHFQGGITFDSPEDLADIVSEFKLSPPAKVLNAEKFTKNTDIALHDVEEFQEFIGTAAIPALLLAVDDNLILLNHNLYLPEPKAIIDAVKLELGV